MNLLAHGKSEADHHCLAHLGLRITPWLCLRWAVGSVYGHKIGACGSRGVNAHFGVLLCVAKFEIRVTVRRGCCSDVARHRDAQNYLQFWSVMLMHWYCAHQGMRSWCWQGLFVEDESLFLQYVDIGSSSLVSLSCELAQSLLLYSRAGFHLARLKCPCCGHL